MDKQAGRQRGGWKRGEPDWFRSRENFREPSVKLIEIKARQWRPARLVQRLAKRIP
jgi:hypothetical protein